MFINLYKSIQSPQLHSPSLSDQHHREVGHCATAGHRSPEVQAPDSTGAQGFCDLCGRPGLMAF